jgi:hypothetical protein
MNWILALCVGFSLGVGTVAVVAGRDFGNCSMRPNRKEKTNEMSTL